MKESYVIEPEKTVKMKTMKSVVISREKRFPNLLQSEDNNSSCIDKEVEILKIGIHGQKEKTSKFKTTIQHIDTESPKFNLEDNRK